jgi:hypothetical protein
MKHVAFSILIVFLFCSFNSSPTNSYEGMIRFSVKISGKEATKVSGMMPTSYTIWIKGNNSLIKTEGGISMMTGDLLFLGAQQKSYLINHGQKTVFSLESTSSAPQENITIEKTAEKKMILGYNCLKYVLKEKEGSATQTYTIWATKDLALPKASNSTGIGFGSFSFQGVEGLPLQVLTNMGDMSMEIMAMQVEKKSLPETHFQLPANYAVKVFDPAAMGGVLTQR